MTEEQKKETMNKLRRNKNTSDDGSESSDDNLNTTLIARPRTTTDKEESAVKELTKEMINTMKLTELKEELKARNLPIYGRKATLKERLRDVIERSEEEEDEDASESETDSDDEDSEDDDSEAHTYRGKRKKSKNEIPKVKNKAASMFTIKDVEGSLCHFTGDDKLPVKKWITDFEDMSKLLEWNELQKFVYGKRMLQGSAKKFVTFEKGITSWDKLKRCLTREFHVRKSNADVHSQLYRRKKLHNESSRQYVYEMQEIADQGDVDEEALVQYVVDGIQDQEANKTILYGSHSIRSLKKKLEIYDRMKERANRRREQPKKEMRRERERATTSKQDQKTHCYVCGSSEHTVKDCTNKDKGPKCFSCNEFGHISVNCRKEKASAVDNTARVNCIQSSSDEQCAVDINDVQCYAMIDTGSVMSLIRQDVYNKIKDAELHRASRILTGFGNKQTIPIGRFVAKLTVDEQKYEVDMLVVPVDSMNSDVILGKNFLSRVEVHIYQGVTIIKAVKTISDEVKKTTDNTEDGVKDEEVTKVMTVNYIEAEELNTRTPYEEKKVEKIIKKQDKAEKKPIELDVKQEGEIDKQIDTSAFTIAKIRIITEEEAKAVLEERRRLAREQTEREAELERQRLEEEERIEAEKLRAEEEEQRRMEKETLRLANKAREAEEQRLRLAIEETKRREEEDRKRREEETRQKQEKEEAERKAREEAEGQRIEIAEHLKKEEEGRPARHKRVEAIILRTRKNQSKPATVYRKGDMMAIKRTQFGSGFKIRKKVPSALSCVTGRRNGRYEVVKVGNREGQKIGSYET